MIRAIIFDLDNCLSAADEPGKGLLEPVFDAIRRVNHWPAFGRGACGGVFRLLAPSTGFRG